MFFAFLTPIVYLLPVYTYVWFIISSTSDSLLFLLLLWVIDSFIVMAFFAYFCTLFIYSAFAASVFQ